MGHHGPYRTRIFRPPDRLAGFTLTPEARVWVNADDPQRPTHLRHAFSNRYRVFRRTTSGDCLSLPRAAVASGQNTSRYPFLS